jgi:putative endonuclease
MLSNNMNKKQLGNWGEEAAAEYLIEHGVDIIGKNVRTQNGEIDIIGKKDGVLVFFEVKTRRSNKFGNPEDAVNTRKQEHIVRSAIEYIQSNLDLDIEWRMDVIAINVDQENKKNIRWFENAISD